MFREVLITGAFSLAVLAPVVAVTTNPAQQSKPSGPPVTLPPGDGHDLVAKNCVGCHQLNVVTNARKSESQWTDTIVEMRNRGANGSDEEMETIVHYLAANFNPLTPPPPPGSAPATPPAAPQTATPKASAAMPPLPPMKPQATPEAVINEHISALNACDWGRMMAQYDDDISFLSKDGGIVSGRAAIGKMFQGALQPPSGGGQCGMKLIPERTIVVGDTVNVIWRVEAPFFAEPYRGSEAFETRKGMLVLQVTTWDPSAIKMKH